MAPGPITKYFIGGHLIILRKLLSQKSEDERENDGVHERRLWASLSGHENTLGTRWQGEQHTWAQRQEQHGSHNEVGTGEHETHGLRDQRVDEEEHERVKHHGGASSETVAELDACTIGAEDDTWAEGEKQSGGDRHFLGGNIWKHL